MRFGSVATVGAAVSTTYSSDSEAEIQLGEPKKFSPATDASLQGPCYC